MDELLALAFDAIVSATKKNPADDQEAKQSLEAVRAAQAAMARAAAARRASAAAPARPTRMDRPEKDKAAEAARIESVRVETARVDAAWSQSTPVPRTDPDAPKPINVPKATDVRELFGNGENLTRAIIAMEVLGPPVAFR